MIPTKGPEIISTLETDKSNEFTVKVDEKTFHLLFDGLYSNKIQSIIREICSNAYDAHRAAGNVDQPFDLSLPTFLEPVFRVRDYGTSMDDDDVRFMYTRVFESKKQESNDFTGCYGLGSKSPFAYTDSFTAIAYLDGEQRTYLVGRNERRVPQINLVSTEATDEPNGFEVSFAVDEHDVSNFTREALRVLEGYAHWTTLPNLNFDYELPEVLLEHDNWQVRKASASMDARVYFRQGTAMYPAPEALDDLMGGHHYYGARSGTYLVIDVPIGSLDTSASREALGQTQATEDTINAEAEKIRSRTLCISAGERRTLTEMIQAKIDEAENHGEACRTLSGFRELFANRLTEANHYSYRGRPVREDIEFLLTSPVKIYKITSAEWSNRSNAQEYHIREWQWDKESRCFRLKQQDVIRDPKTNRWYVPKTKKKERTRVVVNHSIISNPKTFIIVDDGRNVARKNSRIAEYVAEHGYCNNGQPVGWLVVEPTPKDLRLLMENLNVTRDRVINVSKLKDVELAPRITTGRSSVYTTGNNRWEYGLEPFKTRTGMDPSDDPKKIFWLPIKGKSGPVIFTDGGRIWTAGLKRTADELKKVASHLGAILPMEGAKGPDPSEFHGGRQMHYVTQTTVNKNPAVYNESNRLDAVYLKIVADNKDLVMRAYVAQQVKENATLGETTLARLVEGDPSGLTKADFMELYHYNAVSDRTREAKEVIGRCIGDRYPLLSYISGRFASSDVDIYIDAMDCYNEKKELESQVADDSTEED